ncbi:hypothetical protein C8Q77DRAFT_333907 [Trametes polyzona]|nr:hypothetical protein C8Q77DRAFT_333907 [Trametes polyzona]
MRSVSEWRPPQASASTLAARGCPPSTIEWVRRQLYKRPGISLIIQTSNEEPSSPRGPPCHWKPTGTSTHLPRASSCPPRTRSAREPPYVHSPESLSM